MRQVWRYTKRTVLVLVASAIVLSVLGAVGVAGVKMLGDAVEESREIYTQ